MSDIILISKVGLCETIKCTICKNPNQTDRGCDGACQYDKELHAKIVEAVEGIAEQRPHGEWEKYGDKKEAYDIEGNKSWGQMRRCTNCGFIKTYIEDFGFYSICPNCGADMKKRGEAE